MDSEVGCAAGCRRRRLCSTSSIFSKPPNEVTLEDLPTTFATALMQLYGTPKGKFLTGKHGITHFEDTGAKGAKVAVLVHGIGTKQAVYDGPIRDELIAAGYRVINYSFIGHAWSYAMDKNRSYDKAQYLDQVSELLDHLLAENERVDLWVGHSTGGLLGVLAAAGGLKRPIKQLALISPAFWANKPLIARIADRMPTFMGFAGKFLPSLAENAYLENCGVAFAREGATFVYPVKQQTAKEDIEHMFKLHPQVGEAILKTNLYFLRGDLLDCWRTEFKDLVQRKDGPRICLLWGTHDAVVEFKHAHGVVDWGPDRVTLTELQKQGHESILEDPVPVAKGILAFLEPKPASS